MKVKATKKMCKELLKAAKNADYTSIQNIFIDTATPDFYERYVDNNLFNALDYGDYDAGEGLIKFITVIYKEDCYSVNRYFTTRDLVNEFKHSDRTYEGFINQVLSLIEI